jgi:hypothetical protein
MVGVGRNCRSSYVICRLNIEHTVVGCDQLIAAGGCPVKKKRVPFQQRS